MDVKNAINYFGKKNFLGTFQPPVAVIDDASFLTTLSDRDWRSGILEAIKVALIKDTVFFDWIEQNTLTDLCLRQKSLVNYCSKKLGFNVLFNFIPLKPSLIKGSHGRSNVAGHEKPVFIACHRYPRLYFG